jgi:hypothetical protein
MLLTITNCNIHYYRNICSILHFKHLKSAHGQYGDIFTIGRFKPAEAGFGQNDRPAPRPIACVVGQYMSY